MSAPTQTLASTTTPAITMIGSLPHVQNDAAIEFAFGVEIPFFAQLPLKHDTEYMLAQALQGLPGLVLESGGSVRVDLRAWQRGQAEYERSLQAAFDPNEGTPGALERFAPAESSLWRAFVWEARERGVPLAKAQIAGPLTTQLTLMVADPEHGSVRLSRHPELASQVYRTVLARARAMVLGLRQVGVQALFFFDEPGLFALVAAPDATQHRVLMHELTVAVQLLQRDGAQVGVHCCSQTDWEALLAIPLDYLSLDVPLSLPTLIEHPSRLRERIASGLRLALGVASTDSASVETRPEATSARLIGLLSSALGVELTGQVLARALLTPSCGLALSTTGRALAVAQELTEIKAAIQLWLGASAAPRGGPHPHAGLASGLATDVGSDRSGP